MNQQTRLANSIALLSLPVSEIDGWKRKPLCRSRPTTGAPLPSCSEVARPSLCSYVASAASSLHDQSPRNRHVCDDRHENFACPVSCSQQHHRFWVSALACSTPAIARSLRWCSSAKSHACDRLVAAAYAHVRQAGKHARQSGCNESQWLRYLLYADPTYRVLGRARSPRNSSQSTTSRFSLLVTCCARISQKSKSLTS